MKNYIFLSIIIVIVSCNSTETKPPTLDQMAEKYVKLVLEVGQYDSDFVDAYYGPEEWKPSTEKQDSMPKSFLTRAEELLDQIKKLDNSSFSEDQLTRQNMMSKQLTAVKLSLR